MKPIKSTDISKLKQGLPPQSEELIQYMCIENEWLRLMESYTIKQVVLNGGSKLKILHGASGTGKSHFMRYLGIKAQDAGMMLCFLDIKEAEFFLSDPVELYKAVVADFDTSRLKDELQRLILAELGYDIEGLRLSGLDLPEYLMHKEGAIAQEAHKNIRKAINTVIGKYEVDFAFRKFLHVLSEALILNKENTIEIAETWLRGEKIHRADKVSSNLFETLNRSNARIWLYSLIELILLSGYTGLAIVVDQLEAILPNSGARLRYTPMRRNDVYELFRQLIDDLDFFHHTLILVAAEDEVLYNEKQGFESYPALWMRIQPGFIRHERQNPYADFIDANLLFAEALQGGEITRLAQKIKEISRQYPQDFSRQETYMDLSISDYHSLLQHSMIQVISEEEDYA